MGNISDIKKVVLAKWPDAKIKSVKEFSEGYNNVVYDVKLKSWNLVVKLIKLESSVKNVQKQRRVCSLLRKKFKEFPVQRFLKSDVTKKIIDKTYIISEKIEGRSLRELYKKVNNKNEIYEQLGELEGKINSIKFDIYGELDGRLGLVKPFKNWYIRQCKKVEKIFKVLENKEYITKKFLEKNMRFFEKNKSIFKREAKPCLCHGDVSDSNIILIEENGKYKINGLIDFEFASSSGAVKDIFSGRMSFKRKYKFKNRLVKGYQRVGKLPKGWEQLIWMYNWFEYLWILKGVPKMEWRGLNRAKTFQRKEKMKRECVKSINSIIKRFI